MVDQADCSKVPAESRPGGREPIVLAENATTYGQVFPKRAADTAESLVEVHYYHLWKKDCGRMGHALDTEHVSVVIKASDSKWKANLLVRCCTRRHTLRCQPGCKGGYS